ncbi:hypothetical protein B5C26_01525 [Photorhabdus luminescens]|uniref:Type II toxin-antitoxin system mRNA interferase toxin, RelE/StbE family n=2 Tax=Photorhabdus luminescens TaxID=29488 RepID=A0A5C4RME5_PHOLU|nr:hypothetical protein B5C26_01525 [Photorhabdus luminescens]TDB55639.1 hypothetical protein C5468_03170 [Photorhabdus luminescens subsp. mexicana]TNH44637.1 hypothetical protein EP164_03765 [Photorhabdus luminescens subsp. sonorensis]
MLPGIRSFAVAMHLEIHWVYIGYLECHGAPDLLLIYRRTDTELILYRVGSHADLFG